MKTFIISVFVSLWLFLGVGVLGVAQATAPVGTDPLLLNPATGCMEAQFSPEQSQSEREVSAAAILESLRGGSCLRLNHALIQGELDFRTLPVSSVDAYGEDLVVIKGPLVIRNSQLPDGLQAARVPGGPRVRFVGFVIFAGSTLGNTDLTETEFAKEARFDDVRFEQNAKFDRIVFERSVSFANAKFDKPIFFSRVQVTESVDFSGAVFSSLVRAFGLRAQRVDLRKARFYTTTDLSGWQVHALDAAGVQFDQAVNLKNGRWTGPVNFHQAKFLGNGDFSNTRFERMADFSGTQFEKNATFTKVRFFQTAEFTRANFLLSAIFHQTQFFGAALFAHVSFEFTARLTEAQFRGWADFSDATFHELNFENAGFYNPVGPVWQGATFNGKINLNGVVSASNWLVSKEQLKGNVNAGPYPFLGRDNILQTLGLTLMAATAVGIAVLLYLSLGSSAL